MKGLTPGLPVWFLPGLVFLHLGVGQELDAGYEVYTQHRYACDSPSFCNTNRYSIECSLQTWIAMKGVSYGAKPYTAYCPQTQSCLSQRQCCHYQTGDCLVRFSDPDLFEVYRQCSHNHQCGWLYAKSIPLKDECQIRDQSNYIRADFSCVSDNSFIDVCQQQSMTAQSVNLHHSALISPDNRYQQCSCLITPDDCNSTANIQFRAVDIRLQDKDNISSCSRESRVELIGQTQEYVYYCSPEKFLYNYELIHTTSENNVVLYLHKFSGMFPSKMWIEVRASSPSVGVRVTCGPRSVETAKRCPPSMVPRPNLIDVVDDVPPRDSQKEPTIIELDPPIENTNGKKPDLEPSEQHNPAIPAIIGGIAAGVVVLILLMVVVCLILRRRRNKKKEASDIGGKVPCFPYADESHQVNYYESVAEPGDKFCDIHSATNRHIYHQPWGGAGGVAVNNRSKHSDLAYATSEEIKVLIEKMEKDRKNLAEGDVEEYPEPDRQYYTHISNYTFKPHEVPTPDIESDPEEDSKHVAESETESLASDNSGTEKLESEDSKVEADRCLESDSESQHRKESESISQTFDGYESPRVSSMHPSDKSESVRDSERSDQYYMGAGKSLEAGRDSVFGETLSLSEIDIPIPTEHAPPVTPAAKKPALPQKPATPVRKHTENVGPGEVSLGKYREPKGSLNSGGHVEKGRRSENPYTPVYDKVVEAADDTPETVAEAQTKL